MALPPGSTASERNCDQGRLGRLSGVDGRENHREGAPGLGRLNRDDIRHALDLGVVPAQPRQIGVEEVQHFVDPVISAEHQVDPVALDEGLARSGVGVDRAVRGIEIRHFDLDREFFRDGMGMDRRDGGHLRLGKSLLLGS